jgi:phospholipase B1
MVSTKTILALSVTLISNVIALSMSSIAECPALTPRKTAATGVTDLRVDDIKMVAGLGDR